jgi:HSP20 family protein
MSLTLRTSGTRYARDPFALARDLLARDPFTSPRPTSAFVPAVEVKETADAFVVKADLPGVAEDDLDISVHGGVLTIAGARHGEARKDGESYAVHERQFGAFSRAFALPETADGDRVEAQLANGVLTLTIAKRVEAKPRKIAIKRS